MRTILGITSAAAIMLSLAGCSTSRDYATPEALQEAFATASGTCPDPTAVSASMIGDGSHTLACLDTVTMAIVFDDEASKNSYLAGVLGGDDLEAVTGERWALVGPEVAQYAEALGGSVTEG